jgi:hypothetical protein
LGRSKYTRALRKQTSETYKVRRLPRQFTKIIAAFHSCCCVGVQINSSALETVTKVCA